MNQPQPVEIVRPRQDWVTVAIEVIGAVVAVLFRAWIVMVAANALVTDLTLDYTDWLLAVVGLQFLLPRTDGYRFWTRAPIR